MELMRAEWTDERLDEFARGVGERFDRVDNDIRELRADMNAGFERVDREIHGLRGEMNGLRGEMNGRLDRMDTRFDSMQRLIIQVGGGTIATVVVGFLGVIAT